MKIVRPTHHFLSLFAAVSIGTAMPAMAAEFTDSVPMPLVKALLTSPLGDEVRIYSDIPDSFPDVVIPAGFSVIGGIEQNNSSRVILETSIAREDAISALTDAILGAGFVDMQTLAGGRATGFTPSGGMRRAVNFCRDDVGYMTMMVSDQQGLSRVSLGTSNVMFESGASTCAELVQPRTSINGRPGILVSDLEQHMPVMELPDSKIAPPRAFLGVSGRSSSSGGTHETSTRFTSDMTVAQLYQHFAQQIASQGWALDGESTGQVSASGNWIKIPDADTYLHGAFILVQSSEANFTISFQLTKLSVEQ